MTEFRLGPFGFGIPRPDPIKLTKGESVIISYWSWRKFGWIQKLITLDSNRNLTVTVL